MGCLEGEIDSCSETCVKCDVDGTEEISIKEEAIDIKDEIPEATTFPSVKTENVVRLQGLCEVVATHTFRPFITTKMKFLNYTSLFPALCCIVGSIYLLNLDCNPEEKRLFGSHN
jgi:hypothetical protein